MPKSLPVIFTPFTCKWETLATNMYLLFFSCIAHSEWMAAGIQAGADTSWSSRRRVCQDRVFSSPGRDSNRFDHVVWKPISRSRHRKIFQTQRPWPFLWLINWRSCNSTRCKPRSTTNQSCQAVVNYLYQLETSYDRLFQSLSKEKRLWKLVFLLHQRLPGIRSQLFEIIIMHEMEEPLTYNEIEKENQFRFQRTCRYS